MSLGIVSTPLNLPRLEPDDWEKWWHLWEKHSAPLRKAKVSPNSEAGLHVGFDVFRQDSFSPTYIAKYFDLKTEYPMLYEQVMSLPINVYGARFVQSKGDFKAHCDNFYPNWSVRAMFACKDPEPQWYYTKMDYSNPRYLRLPPTTNWWAYHDGVIKHGTIFREEYPKIILQVFSGVASTKAFVESHLNTFPEHQLQYDIG